MHALRGKDFIEYDNPYDVGMTGLLGFASGYKAIKEADVLLMLGTDFPYQQFYPDNAKVIQVDIRGSNLGRQTPIDLGLRGTVADTLTGPCTTTGRPASRWMRSPSMTATAARSGRNTLLGLLISSPQTMRSSPSTWARRWCGRRATSG